MPSFYLIIILVLIFTNVNFSLKIDDELITNKQKNYKSLKGCARLPFALGVADVLVVFRRI